MPIGDLIIKPCFPFIEERSGTSIPASVVKGETFSLPPRHNETIFMNLSGRLTRMGIKNYCGSYNGPGDIKDFKGVIHLPYAWSNIALFENLQLGLPYFVPTVRFLRELMNGKNYWFQDRSFLLDQNLFHLTEWYCEEVKDVLIYFDSWEDLVKKIKTTDYAAARARTKAYGLKHKATMLERWKKVFDEFKKTG